MTRSIAAVAVSFLAACSQPPVTQSSNASTAATSVGAERALEVSADASTNADASTSAAAANSVADPVEAAKARFSFTHAARWPTAGGFGDVIALAGPMQRAQGSLTWAREGETALVEGRSFPLGSQSIRALSAMDVGGESGDELLVFGEGMESFGSTVAVFSLPAQRAQPLDDGLRSAAFDGARSTDDVRARLPLDRARTAQERAALSDTAMLAQLAFASDAELTATIAARGIQLCAVRAPAGARRVERCRTLTGRALTARVLETDVRARLRHMFNTQTTLTYSCEASPEHRCGAQTSGGYETFVSIAGAGADRRIAKITNVDHEIGE